MIGKNLGPQLSPGVPVCAMCPSSTWQNPGNLVIEKEGKKQWCRVLLKLAAPSLFEISRELSLSNGWKSGEGRWHFTVIMVLSATLCYSPINSKFSVQVGSREADARGGIASAQWHQGLLGLIFVGQTALCKVRPFLPLALHWACLNWSELLKEHFLLWLLETGSSAGLGSFS